MFSWAYEIPNWQVGAILLGGSVVLMWVGIIFTQTVLPALICAAGRPQCGRRQHGIGFFRFLWPSARPDFSWHLPDLLDPQRQRYKGGIRNRCTLSRIFSIRFPHA